ncbi:MAG TPA: EVE domain-containing protein [Verrucomicrobiae bacterium]|jgi:predicted RNA-binding protein with PUA-like domain|nr:EVE domain-containing protein [Verrucomicrobiae bacterium]
MARRHWLMKSEPDVYSIADLEKDKATFWDGVRNYQARNFMRDDMKPGDLVFFYHSNAEPAGIAGIAEVAAKGRIDESAFNKKSPYHDPDSDPEKPGWYGVDLKFVRKFSALIPLEELRRKAGLEKMPLLQKGQRLSVQPVAEKEWKIVMEMTS